MLASTLVDVTALGWTCSTSVASSFLQAVEAQFIVHADFLDSFSPLSLQVVTLERQMPFSTEQTLALVRMGG